MSTGRPVPMSAAAYGFDAAGEANEATVAGAPQPADASAPVPDQEAPRRRGRRPAGEDTRAAIVAAARGEFAARGYEGATLRGIARAAGVDPRLVHHYFEGKDDVFVAVMDLPARPGELVAAVIPGGIDGLGERLLRMFFSVWDPPEGRERVVALVSSVLTSESAALMVKQFLTQEIFGRLVTAVGADDPDLRASLLASQMVGLMMARYVVKLEPLASADPEDLIPFIAPTLERYLGGEPG
ncbi:MAG TPA: TetR family transcriptional regulator [Kineosporiaceae bacterium]